MRLDRFGPTKNTLFFFPTQIDSFPSSTESRLNPLLDGDLDCGRTETKTEGISIYNRGDNKGMRSSMFRVRYRQAG